MFILRKKFVKIFNLKNIYKQFDFKKYNKI